MKEKKNKIKGCPFCGGAPKIEHILTGTPYEAYFIQCTNEKCECAIKQPYYSEQDVINAWNNRANVYVELVEDSAEKKRAEPWYDTSMEQLTEVKERIESKFGTKALWPALMLIPMIDKETWKFPEGIFCSVSTMKDIMKFIEEDETLKELFSREKHVL